MAVVRLLALLLLASALSGCQAIRDDPIVGDKPWQPGSATPPNAR
ncbi:MAG TPA: hypothetical protein VH092_10405 [Urbifossiella sp.]|nr:hypothetical protein [Urbifossiella sp.]